jgi:Protein kinase domain/Putative peptidoglycan binding domain
MTESHADQTPPVDRTEHHAALALGTMIGRYKVVSVLGQGGFGITYRARDAHLDRDVAIKEYLPSALAIRQDGTAVLPRSTEISEDFVWGRGRFLDEAKTIARLGDAPAVVRVHDFLEAHGTAYVVMQLLEGETLAARLKRDTRLPQTALERIVYPLLDGLEQIHKAGFLHRDIKPANIVLAADGAPTLIDFGASRTAVAGRTQSMTAVFTPGYGAPEQATSGRQGPWTDIFGLAATLYTCVSGKPPPSVLDRALEDVPVSAALAGGRNYAPSLLAAIDAGLLLKGNSRPQSVEAWRQVFITGVWDGKSAAAETLVVQKQATSAPQDAAASPSPQAATPQSRAVRSPGKVLWLALIAIAAGYWALVPRATIVPSPPASPAVAGRSDAMPNPAETRAPAPAAEEAKRRDEAEDLKKVEEQRRAEAQTAAAAAQTAEEAKARAEETAKSDEQAKRAAAEQEEGKLSLTSRDRQKIQVALASLGFNPGGADGVFGSRSRQVIAAWQQKNSAPATGFLTASQNAELLRTASAAIARWEEDQRRVYVPEKKPRSAWHWPWN